MEVSHQHEIQRFLIPGPGQPDVKCETYMCIQNNPCAVSLGVLLTCSSDLREVCSKSTVNVGHYTSLSRKFTSFQSHLDDFCI